MTRETRVRSAFGRACRYLSIAVVAIAGSCSGAEPPDNVESHAQGAIGPERVSMVAEVTVPECVFGDNLPWLNYGNDVGSSNPKLGFRFAREELSQKFRRRIELGTRVCRVWIFADGRSGFEQRGGHISLAPSVNEDLDALFQAAREAGMKLIPVLLDHAMWDNKDKDIGGGPVGEHADWIKDASLRNDLINSLVMVVADYQGRFPDVISFWDLANEPCHGAALTESTSDFEALSALINNLALGVLTQVPDVRISVGFRDWGTLVRWQPRILYIKTEYEKAGGKDFNQRFIPQLHYYRTMEFSDGRRLGEFHVSHLLGELALGAMKVCLGEMDPAPAAAGEPALTPEQLRDAEFSWVLYWQDDSGRFAPVPDVNTAKRPVTFEIPAVPPQQEREKRSTPRLGTELMCAEEKPNAMRLVGSTAGSGLRAAYWLYGATAPRDVEGKMVALDVRLIEQMRERHPAGWFVHVLLVDGSDNVWFGPGEFVPTYDEDVRVWAVPTERPSEVYPGDAKVELSRISRIGLWVVPALPVEDALDVDIVLRPPIVVAEVPDHGRHGIFLAAPPVKCPKPCEAVNLLQEDSQWEPSVFQDSLGLELVGLAEGQLIMQAAFERPSLQKEKGEAILDLTSIKIPVRGDGGNIEEICGAPCDLRGCLVRFHIRRTDGDPVPHYYQVAICDAAFRRANMIGEVKLLGGQEGWVQYWIPDDEQVASCATEIRLQAAVDSDDHWSGKITVDKAEIVPMEDEEPLKGNLLQRQFSSVQVETWHMDRGFLKAEVQEGEVVVAADIKPGSETQACGRLIYDVRQNSTCGCIDLRKAMIEVGILYHDAPPKCYFFELGLEDEHRQLGALPIKSVPQSRAKVGQLRQVVKFNLRFTGVPGLAGAAPPDLSQIVRIYMKLGPRQDCKKPYKGKFRVLKLSVTH